MAVRVILIADDNAVDRDIFRVMLGESEFRILEASTGEEAVRIFEADRPDCVLLDYALPDLTGIEVLERILAVDADAAVIMLSGSSMTETAVDALRGGVTDFFDKERIGRDGLRRSVRNAIEKRDLVFERTQTHRQLERTVVELKKRNDEIQSFYHTLSHELKTPLTAIQEFVSLVLDGIAGPISETQREYLEIAVQNCGRVARHVNDILDITRLETGKLSLELSDHSAERIVAEAVQAFDLAATEREIDLVFACEPDLPQIRVDEARVAQVLGNLIGNALKFTKAGGRVDVRARSLEAGWVEVSVADNGRGIDPESRTRVFERLYQVCEGDSVLEEGTGLGLNICQDLVELHGGEIEVESEVDRGSTFRFTLPVSEASRPLAENVI